MSILAKAYWVGLTILSISVLVLLILVAVERGRTATLRFDLEQAQQLAEQLRTENEGYRLQQQVAAVGAAAAATHAQEIEEVCNAEKNLLGKLREQAATEPEHGEWWSAPVLQSVTTILEQL